MTASEPTILVTGANGYVAGHIVNELLNRGYKVCGTVRSEKAASQIRNTFPRHVDTQLTIAFVQDLTNPDAFCDAIDESITAVIHTASPACYSVDNVVQDMLHPTIRGATGVLDAVEKFADKARFTKFVHLSSFAAMLDHSKGKRVGHVYTEEDWNPVTFEEAAQLDDAVMAYEAAKALSERAVWAWMDKHQPSFKLTCVNPSLILGPHVETLNSLSEVRSTARFLWGLVDASSIPPLDFAGFVDVRDAAAMMVAVLQTPAADGRRFLVAHHFDWQSAADAAREGLPQVAHRIPVGEPGTGRAKSEREIYMVDGRDIVEVTGVDYRSLQQTIVDTLRQFLEVESRS